MFLNNFYYLNNLFRTYKEEEKPDPVPPPDPEE